jgi:hypothetical protein
VHRVVAPTLPERFHGQQQLVTGALVAGSVPERNRTFPVLDNRDIGVSSDFQSADVVG